MFQYKHRSAITAITPATIFALSAGIITLAHADETQPPAPPPAPDQPSVQVESPAEVVEPPSAQGEQATVAPGEQAQADVQAPQTLTLDDLLQRDQLTGNWWGARTALSDIGLSLDITLIFDHSHNVSGGASQGSATRHVLSVAATVDFTKLLDLPSGLLFVDFHQQNGPSGSEEVSDMQGVGNWDADGLTQVSELWFEYEFFDGMVRTKIGKVDANSEFAYSELSGEFVHGSAGTTPTNLVLPTFPDPATSINVFVYPIEGVSLGFGLYDGALAEGVRTGARGPATFWGDPADLFMIGEVAYQWHLLEEKLPGRVAVGGWYHTGEFLNVPAFELENGTGGFHVFIDQMVWLAEAWNDGDELPDFSASGLGLFISYDWTDPDIMFVEHHINAGFTWRGLIPSRNDDVLGFMVSWLQAIDMGQPDPNETALELMYKAYLTPAVMVQPYVQYIVSPGGIGVIDDAVNLGARVEVSF